MEPELVTVDVNIFLSRSDFVKKDIFDFFFSFPKNIKVLLDFYSSGIS